MLYKIAAHRVPWMLAMILTCLVSVAAALLSKGTPSQASSSQPEPVQANLAAALAFQSSPASVNPAAPNGAATFNCAAGTLIYVVADVTFTAVGCDNGPAGNPTFFAIASSDPKAPEFLSAFTTAFVMGKALYIWYEADSAAVNGICSPSNCRKIYSAWITR